nr:uncharacterized protein LOC112017521 [Quercus suber]
MGKNTSSNPEEKKARADWDVNPTWTTIFCDLCVEQIQAGNRTKGAGFNTKGWANVVTKFCDMTGQDYDMDQLKMKGTIAAPNDWWKWKLKELPKAKKFREKGLQNLEQLEIMFRDVTTTGVAAWTPSSNTLPPTIPEEGAGDLDGSSEFKDKTLTVCCKGKLFNHNRNEGTSQESPSSIDNVMAIVRALPGVDNQFAIQASVVLLKKSRREMFLTFKEPKSKLEWLQEMICLNQKK